MNGTALTFAPVADDDTATPPPTPSRVLFDFEDGTQGWSPASFNPTAGETAS